jgi:hypothetical protein
MTTVLWKSVLRIASLVVLCSAWSQGQDCSFVTSGTTITLMNNCTASQTVTIPDGFTLDGKNHMITAVADPGTGGFIGSAVVKNGGTTATVKNLIIDEPNLQRDQTGMCGGFIGIQFTNASGSVANTTVLHVGQGCGIGAGLAISTFNPPCDGTHPNTQTLTVTGSKAYLASEIALDGECDVKVNASGSTFSASVFSVLLTSGASGSLNSNQIETDGSGNGIAISLQSTQPAATKITNNNINLIAGLAGTGIDLRSDGVIVSGNRLFNYGAATGVGVNNVGAAHGGTDNKITNNQARCYATPFKNAGGNGNNLALCPF